MEDFDKLWNYSDPAGTEVKFKEVLKDLSPEKDRSAFLQLQTQIARTYGLRYLFDEAQALLNEVEQQLPAVHELAHVRYHLERGRTFNSAHKTEDATIHFKQAKEIAEQLAEDFYSIDAIHMLAIAAPLEESIRLNEAGIILAESSKNERAKNWLGPFYNNLGWSYFDSGQYEKALSVFLRSLKWREDKKSEQGIFIAKWAVARALRALNRLDDALKIQLGLFEESVSIAKPDGFVHEELGELFLLKNDKLKSSFHFEKAYGLLSEDKYLQQNEKDRLERIQKLAHQ
ncbi:MAG: hypothetical protein JWO06_4086 [Bacteroidota bacterium]|nr:hypothetical protein [Bacteroidota bacterium]